MAVCSFKFIVLAHSPLGIVYPCTGSTSIAQYHIVAMQYVHSEHMWHSITTFHMDIATVSQMDSDRTDILKKHDYGGLQVFKYGHPVGGFENRPTC